MSQYRRTNLTVIYHNVNESPLLEIDASAIDDNNPFIFRNISETDESLSSSITSPSEHDRLNRQHDRYHLGNNVIESHSIDGGEEFEFIDKRLERCEKILGLPFDIDIRIEHPENIHKRLRIIEYRTNIWFNRMDEHIQLIYNQDKRIRKLESKKRSRGNNRRSRGPPPHM